MAIDAADAANQADQDGQFADRLLVLIVFQLAIGLPEVQRRQFGFVGFEDVQQLLQHGVGDVAAALWLIVKDAQRFDLVFVASQSVGKFLRQVLGIGLSIGGPTGEFQFIQVKVVDGFLSRRMLSISSINGPFRTLAASLTSCA